MRDGSPVHRHFVRVLDGMARPVRRLIARLVTLSTVVALAAESGPSAQVDTSQLVVIRGRVVAAEGRDQPGSQSRLCVKGRYGWDYAASPQRLTVPLIRIESSIPRARCRRTCAATRTTTGDAPAPAATAAVAAAAPS